MVGLEELLLANMIVRRGLADAGEVRAALGALDRAPSRGDLYGMLAARGGPLAQPGAREQALARVRRWVLAKAEASFAARLRATGVIAPETLDALVARQMAEGLAWRLGERLVAQGLLPDDIRARVAEEANRDVREHEGAIVARHRASGFAESVGAAPVVPAGKTTREYVVSPGLDTSGEVLLSFGLTPHSGPPVLPQQSAMPSELDATLRYGPGDAPMPMPTQPQPLPPPAAQPVPTPRATGRQGPLAPGAVLAGKYEIGSILGKGGMGVVYRARSRERGVDVAVKAVPAGQESDMVSRFKREVVKREAPLDVPRALGFIEQLLHGVAACHRVKVIHRDLKPENVRVARADGKEVAKIVDFGIARLIGQDTVIAERIFTTVKGTLSGTPAYVAPELVEDPELVDARCDLYAIGVILYELLTGKLPFRSKSLREMLEDAVSARPIPLAEAAPGHAIPPAVERFLFRLLEKDPLVRPQIAEEALAALAEARAPAAAPRQRSFTGKLVSAITRLFGGRGEET